MKKTYKVFKIYSSKDDNEFYRDIIENNIGNPDEIILQTDWQEYIPADDFLMKISNPK